MGKGCEWEMLNAVQLEGIARYLCALLGCDSA